MTQTKNIVLVHGGFVDGSGWESVYSLLKKDGYNVSIVQNPTISLADDVLQFNEHFRFSTLRWLTQQPRLL